ncbi:SAM-dependent methyltransferase [Naumannella cuiyingiana]|uniref:SAM-dependent methyltransferase n=1 Tax=Naumannella cuiyingiana TaxID=1347891 RepID=A0A7Z0D7W8_9ACTN|nr:class I SAM-dependent methyltransferase [Naumannella cuiyingiana]NYI70556.1 SAM-dependent methyltransferase [Naumannella cuiyingiana]
MDPDSTDPGSTDPDGYFGASVAATYDDDIPEGDHGPTGIARTVDFLAELASGRPALEFAIGTGRIALPLAEAGVPVTGIELSQAMVERLRAKPGGAELPVTIGDMSTTRVPGSFGLVYLVFNTISNLTSQDAQVACFGNAAAHLEPGGRFVVEVGVPDLRRLPPGQTAVPFDLSDDHLGFDTYDTVTQAMTSHHVTIRDGVAERTSVPFRYAWPAEFDLMARIAGMRLVERWDWWDRSPFTAESRRHVSVWERPAG